MFDWLISFKGLSMSAIPQLLYKVTGAFSPVLDKDEL
jgi:hypothetical protein